MQRGRKVTESHGEPNCLLAYALAFCFNGFLAQQGVNSQREKFFVDSVVGWRLFWRAVCLPMEISLQIPRGAGGRISPVSPRVGEDERHRVERC
eukprot:s262_g16.t1